MSSYAIFRLPFEGHSTLMVQHHGEPDELQQPADLGGRQGFVMAPFAASAAMPLLLLRPDSVCQLANDKPFPPDVVQLLAHAHLMDCDQRARRQDRQAYARTFSRFYGALQTGTFLKLVLSRCRVVAHGGQPSPLQLYLTAVSSFPRLFIALVSMPRCGTWLVATPETLLSGRGDTWTTMALAGTQKLQGSDLQGEGDRTVWDAKNIQEQRYVASYMAAQLQPFACQLQQSEPHTVRAANLVHLRSDFTFTLSQPQRVGQLLQALHPTPAVCGLPKEQARQFILDNEPAPRRYYSGFMGPLMMPDTHLYVSLRCMEICRDAFCLHAGGGLVSGSCEEQEWLETEAKMETMNRCLC